MDTFFTGRALGAPVGSGVGVGVGADEVGCIAMCYTSTAYMNRNTGIAVAMILVAGLAVFGILWTIPRPDRYLPQEKRPPLETAALP